MRWRLRKSSLGEHRSSGCAPTPTPAFLELPSGKVVGKPIPVQGREVPALIVKTPAQLAAEQAAKRARAEAKAAAREAKRAAAAAEAKRKAAERAAAHETKADKKKAERPAEHDSQEGQRSRGTAVMDQRDRPRPPDQVDPLRKVPSRPLRSQATAERDRPPCMRAAYGFFVTARSSPLGRGCTSRRFGWCAAGHPYACRLPRPSAGCTRC